MATPCLPARAFRQSTRRSALRGVAVIALVALGFGASAAASSPVLAASRVSVSVSVSVSDGDDANLLRVTMNAERAVRLRAFAEASVAASRIASADKIRSLERRVLDDRTYVAPVIGPVTQWYGSHPGIDIAPPYGTPIGAVHSGVVTFVGWDDGYGMHVEVVQSDGYVTTYSHMSAFTVNVGQLVVAGQQLGSIGSTGWSTGPHLHFEVHLPNGERTDPALWMLSHGIVL